MKKLLTLGVVGALVMTGCATSNSKPQPADGEMAAKHDKKHDRHHHRKDPHGKPEGEMPERPGRPPKDFDKEKEYDCKSDTTVSTVKVNYNPEADNATITFDGKTVTLPRTQSASGMAFTGETGGVKYQWQAKGRDAFLDVTQNGATTSLSCQHNFKFEPKPEVKPANQ